MKKLSLLLAAGVGLCIAGCDIDTGIKGSGHVVTVQRPIGAFTELSGRGGLRIEWRTGQPSLAITTDDNLVDHLQADTVNNRLELRTRERVRPTHGLKIAISSPSLYAAELSGASDLVAHGVTGKTFAVQTKGASSITLDGTVDELLADLTGASDLKAKGLQAKVAEISMTGASDAWVHVAEKLRVAITGAGDVTYSGSPQSIERKITGAGTIRHKE
jgi:putative autotransporter adhesin-like protein